MTNGQSEAFSRILIDKALEFSAWDLLDPKQVTFELHTGSGRADYLLKDKLGRVLCVLEAKREELDPYDAKEQARGYAENLKAPFVILSNGREHWFWNYERADQRDAYRIERLPSRDDLERVRLKNMQPPRPLGSEIVRPDYMAKLKYDLTLRGYQIAALDEIAKQYDGAGGRKFLLEMATGTGKTLLCAALIRRFLQTRNAERVLFIVDRIELAKQTMEDFAVVLPEFKPVIFKTARRTGELLGSSVVVATIQSLMVDRRYREEFTPFYFDLVINDEAHRSIYGDAREVVQFFQATRVGLTATPKAYLKNINIEELGEQDPKSLEARQLRDTYHYFGCKPGFPTFRYDLVDAVKDPEGPFLCLPKIFDVRSDITTKALADSGWSVTINEQEENFKVQDLERKVFTPARNRLMCEAFLQEAQKDPTGKLGRSIVFAVNQAHATTLTKIFNELQPESAVTITSRIKDASSIAKEFRDGKRKERIAVSVDMLSTGYNCRDVLNIGLMRPIFSPTEYIQIKGRGTRRYTFKIDHTEYEKKNYFLLDFCGVAEYFEEKYDYSIPLKIPREKDAAPGKAGAAGEAGHAGDGHEGTGEDKQTGNAPREIPVWEGTDTLVTREVVEVGPDGQKVDVMTFRGSFEQDLRSFAEQDADMQAEISITPAKTPSFKRDESLVDLPFPARIIVTIPFGTLFRETNDENNQPLYALERGVPVLPSVGDPVLLPSAAQLRSIVESKSDDRLVQIGTAPFAGNARVWVHPDKLFGRHVAVLGNTGSGKSCSVAGIIRWSLEAAAAKDEGRVPSGPTNTRFIILDPNGEYADAFKDGLIPVRRFAVGGAGGAKPLTVPGWLWNGQEWAAFTSAQPGVQRPLLLRSLRQLRNVGSSISATKAQTIRRYLGYIRQVEQLFADLPQSVTGWQGRRDFGSLLEGLLGLTETDQAALAGYGAEAADLAAAIVALRAPVEQVRSTRHWTSSSSSGYNDFQPNDLVAVLTALRSIADAFPITVTHGEISEDAPVRFDVAALPDRIREVALATGGQALNNVEPLINRIQVMLGDSGLRPVIDTDGAASLSDWLDNLLGPSDQSPEPLAILDLSLVPSDVMHVAVAVISRLVFEALQRHLNSTSTSLPTVLVLEEAHSFVRKDADAGSSAQAADLCRQTFERIAREGRKFGLGLMLASQRPSELSPTVLAQCNSFLLHRIVNDVDQNLVRRLVPDALGGLLGELPTLPSQQAILLGWAVPTPVLVRVRDLAKSQRPRSDDPKFWATWLRKEGVPPDWSSLASDWEQAEESGSHGSGE